MKLFTFFGVVGVAVFFASGAASLAAKENDPATVNYHLWFTDNFEDPENVDYHRVHEVETISNTTFFEVMEIAALEHEDYYFEYITFPSGLGRFITSIGGQREDLDNDIYWMIYILNGPPDVTSLPTEEQQSDWGVDFIRVQHNETYLFWRKYVDPASYPLLPKNRKRNN